MHESDQFRHLGHLDALGHDRTGRAADQQTDDHVTDSGRGQLGPKLIEEADGGDNRQGHSEHSVHIAASGSGRM